MEIRNPANPSKVVATYKLMQTEEVDSLVERAKVAQGAWAKVSQLERGRIVRDFLDALDARKEDIASSITAEMGKILAESRGEVGKALGEGNMTIERAASPIGDVLPSQIPGVTAYSIRRPRGVILGISPWNFPFGTPIRKTIPALLYGNAMILKPAILCPGAAVIMEDVARGILPDGLFQLALGPGELGQQLCEHPDVDAISFTGSVGVGKKVAVAAVSHLAEISLELGGKNPVILNDASDLEKVLDQIFSAAFAISGQRCTAISRVIVHENIADEVVRGLSERAKATIPSDGSEHGAKMGPLSSQRQLDDVAGFVCRAKDQGATIVAGGNAIDTPHGGYFYTATILSDVTPDMEIAREEVFGPVLSVLRYQEIDEALRIANDVDFGLTSCLYSEKSPIIERFLSESESGMLHVNAGSFPENHVPFVGIKDSALGVGGSNGSSTIQFFTSEHAVYRKGHA